MDKSHGVTIGCVTISFRSRDGKAAQGSRIRRQVFCL